MQLSHELLVFDAGGTGGCKGGQGCFHTQPAGLDEVGADDKASAVEACDHTCSFASGVYTAVALPVMTSASIAAGPMLRPSAAVPASAT